MGCGDDCPFVPGLRHEDWPLPDPKKKWIERVKNLVRSLAKAGMKRTFPSNA